METSYWAATHTHRIQCCWTSHVFKEAVRWHVQARSTGKGFIWAFSDEDGDGYPDWGEEGEEDEFFDQFVELNKDGYFTFEPWFNRRLLCYC